MSKSLPSKETIVADIPEVSDFGAEFKYNFFVKDERVNGAGTSIQKSILDKTPEGYDQNYINYIKTRVPRYVQFNISPVLLGTSTKDSNEKFGKPSSIINRGLIRNNIKNIIHEDEFSDYGFVNIELSDPNMEDKLHTFISGTMLYILEQPKTPIITKPIKAASILTSLGLPPISPSTKKEESIPDLIAKAFSTEKSPSVLDLALLTKIYKNNKTFGQVFYQNGKQINDEFFENLKKVRVQTQLSTKFSNTLIKSALSNPFSTLERELLPIISAAKNLQDYARSRQDTFDINDYKTSMKYIAVRPLNSKNFRNKSEVVGYIIDKYQILNNGNYIELEPIILESQNVNLAVDYNIKYGTNYSYDVRTIVKVEFAAISEETNELVVATALISSKPSNKVIVDCGEFIPPPPPSDFAARWNYEDNTIMLHWAFPPNKQRDIKKFQVFRRRSLNEPFQLIKEYDFDDTIGKLTYQQIGEFPSSSVVTLLTSPITFFYDEEFSKDDNFIYAVACLDAHGMTSGYSTQLYVRFDKYQNKLITKAISLSNAPKPYPNIYLLRDTFVDAMFDSGHRQMKLVFNPEYYSVYNNKESVTDLVSTKQKNGSYRLQLINLDKQQQQIININLDDRRTGPIS